MAGDETRTPPRLAPRLEARRAADPDRAVRSTRIEPYGLRLFSTADWTVRTLHPLLRWFVATGDALVGTDSIPVSLERSKSTGLAAYSGAGRRLASRFRETACAGLWGAAWPYAYVTVRGRRRTHVVDLRTGRTANVLRGIRMPLLLAP